MLRDRGLSKTEARLVIPVSSASERIWWINARAMRDFLKLRLPADAESEIRRLAHLLLDIVYRITPSLFEDICEKYGEDNNG
jgi:thymidylate synthase ThyX